MDEICYHALRHSRRVQMQPHEIAAVAFAILFAVLIVGNTLYGVWEDWKAERKERDQNK
jgi:hypothetical protein